MTSLNKTALVARASEDAAIPKNIAVKAVDAVFDTIAQALAVGDDVSIANFGVFSVTSREAREGRNPATGAVVAIAASSKPKFKAAKALKDAVN